MGKTKVNQILEWQQEGITREQMAENLNMKNINSITNLMNKHNYRYDKTLKQYIEKDTISEITKNNDVVIENKAIKKANNNITMGFNLNEEQMNKLSCLVDRYDEIIKILNENNKDIENNEVIKINIPRSESKRKSIIVNAAVINEFDVFTEKHCQYSKKDLFSQALKEFMDKYSDIDD